MLVTVCWYQEAALKERWRQERQKPARVKQRGADSQAVLCYSHRHCLKGGKRSQKSLSNSFPCFCNTRSLCIIYLSILVLFCCSSQRANNKQCTTQAAHGHWRFLGAPALRFQAAELPGSHLLAPYFLSEQMEPEEQEPRAQRGHLCCSYSNYWSCNCRVVTHTNTHTQCLLSLHC